MMKRSVPPAIIKSATVIFKNLNIPIPTATKAIATASAVIMDCRMIFLTFFFSTPSVRLMNTGNTPMALKATKRGTKHSQNDFISFNPFRKHLSKIARPSMNLIHKQDHWEPPDQAKLF